MSMELIALIFLNGVLFSAAIGLGALLVVYWRRQSDLEKKLNADLSETIKGLQEAHNAITAAQRIIDQKVSEQGLQITAITEGRGKFRL